MLVGRVDVDQLPEHVACQVLVFFGWQGTGRGRSYGSRGRDSQEHGQHYFLHSLYRVLEGSSAIVA